VIGRFERRRPGQTPLLSASLIVTPGLVPGIYETSVADPVDGRVKRGPRDMDGRVKRGHDEKDGDSILRIG